MNGRKTGKSRRAVWYLVVAGLLLVLGISFALASGGEQISYEHFEVTHDSIVRTVSGAGRVVPLHRETLLAAGGTQVVRVLVSIGDIVRSGEVLMRTAAGVEVKAPFDGEVSALFVDVNEWVSPGARLIEVTDYQNLEISAQVDELDVAKLHVGQSAQIDIIAFTDEDIVGTITSIARQGVLSGGITTFAVKVSVPHARNILIGMSAEIRVEVARVDNVLVVPLEAVQYEGDSPYVLVTGDQRTYERVRITIGMSDGELVEVKSGLTLGQTVAYVRPIREQQNFGPGMGGQR
ncbi:MAG: efflux RND transporter periplasmic adaptor subunit [Selenomonadales bacterium]|jgi:HlyD family secretion protein|nr:efflux RND transporter periplasmic adaptor subunit [Selenomonadales bacterium]